MPKSEKILEVEAWCDKHCGLFTTSEVRDAVCAIYEVLPDTLYKRNGVRAVTDARHTLIWLLIRLNKMSFKAIGKYLHQADHTTALNSNRVANEFLEGGDVYFVNRLVRIYNMLKQSHEKV